MPSAHFMIIFYGALFSMYILTVIYRDTSLATSYNPSSFKKGIKVISIISLTIISFSVEEIMRLGINLPPS